MKKSNITIPFEDEKLQALRLFAGKKDADIDSELSDAIQKLYEKYVPKDARELVEMMAGKPDVPKVRTTRKDSAPSKNTAMSQVSSSSADSARATTEENHVTSQ